MKRWKNVKFIKGRNKLIRKDKTGFKERKDKIIDIKWATWPLANRLSNGYNQYS